jgi:RNA polymerase sigma factor (sigma-70 family)
LLARCRRQEPAAQRLLYERFAGPMLALARQYAPTVADAEDALQEAFIKVFEYLPAQRVDSAFAGWVRQIVVRTAVDAWRQRRAQRPTFELETAQHVPAPEASAVELLTLEEVRALIERLPDGCRLVLLLYTVEGYSHAEIAQVLGIGESASSAQLTRARQRLALLVAEANRQKRPAPPGTAPTVADEYRPLPFHPLTTLLFQ